VADALRAEGARVSFIGGHRAEAELVPAAGFELHSISVEGLSRSNPLRAARALTRAATACLAAWRLLGQLAPEAVMGGGGYAAGPVGLAALVRGLPLVLTEADSRLGLTNRLLAPGARRVCLAFPPPRPPGPRYLVTGRPIPTARHDRATARARLGIGEHEQSVLVFGGSLGARSLNFAAIEGLSQATCHVLHICGRRDYPELRERPRSGCYDLREYLALEDFADALAASDLVVARAGGSIFEIAAHGLPAILVPYPHAVGAHQDSNARWVADAGAAIVISDEQLTAAGLAREVAHLLAEPARLERMAAASRGLARPEAARDVARELLRAGSR
jgi:UDP-N-acetylglucosamine--N-acetylmuramyl-(pentapeptide) pyrophosphoryl-undecaprenol N-acetylglucosamine transferase